MTSAGGRRRPDVARTTMRDDTTRMLVNRAQFDWSSYAKARSSGAGVGRAGVWPCTTATWSASP
ncbi:DUF6192 family protein [Streptomyces sp. NPDC014892]|uniref:DUF6192 family protein n=1 Tax=Streptomyces sp. NPDC014892 TaxID=3364930 RepID=UPI0036FC90A0